MNYTNKEAWLAVCYANYWSSSEKTYYDGFSPSAMAPKTPTTMYNTFNVRAVRAF
jgi:hypothetical protein